MRKQTLFPRDQPVSKQELKVWRKGLGWTQAEAADWLGYSVRAYENWEQGRPITANRTPAIRQLMALATKRRRA